MTLTVEPPPTPPAPRTRAPRSIPVRIPRKQINHSHRGIVFNWALVSLAVLFLWIVAFALGLSSFRYSHSQAVLYSKFRQEVAEATAPIGGAITPGAPVAVMDAPAAGLHHEVIVEGTTSGDMQKGPGHLRNTPLPGQVTGTVEPFANQPPVSVIFGRGKLFGGPFHRIGSMRAGDVITMTTGLGIAKFVVLDVRHAGDPVPAFPSASAGLTLVTSRGGWQPTSEIYVDAVMQGQPFGDNGGRPSAVPKAELPMQTDPVDALYPLVLWLPVLLFGGAGLVWAHHHWGAWQTWVVGVPIVLAGLWGVTETATQFLPNLI